MFCICSQNLNSKFNLYKEKQKRQRELGCKLDQKSNSKVSINFIEGLSGQDE
jgi:hypothetical protein